MSSVDDVFDSWEEMEESGALDKQLKSLKINNLDNMDDIDSPRLTDNNVSNNTKMIILGEDGLRSRRVPPEPTVKILKRPVRNAHNADGSTLNGDKPKQPIKSLKQREREYAEARKRIFLGEEKSQEDSVLQQVSMVQPKATSPSGNGLPNNVLRMPNGPDGTRGFNVRRFTGKQISGYEAKSCNT